MHRLGNFGTIPLSHQKPAIVSAWSGKQNRMARHNPARLGSGTHGAAFVSNTLPRFWYPPSFLVPSLISLNLSRPFPHVSIMTKPPHELIERFQKEGKDTSNNVTVASKILKKYKTDPQRLEKKKKKKRNQERHQERLAKKKRRDEDACKRRFELVSSAFEVEALLGD